MMAQGGVVTLERETARPRSSWPPERVETLMALYGEGLSHALIARAMKTTKGVIDAKVAREGLSRPVTLVDARPRGAAARKEEPADPKAVKAARAAAYQRMLDRFDQEVPAGIGFVLMDLEATSCRWPIGLREGETVFCGCRKLGARPYCLPHARRAWPTAVLESDTASMGERPCP